MYTIVRLYILVYTTPQAVNCIYSDHVEIKDIHSLKKK